MEPTGLPNLLLGFYNGPMAKVLLFLQLIVALLVLPFWPGLEPGYAVWGLVYLGFVVALPTLAVASVYEVKTGLQALADAWSTTTLGPESRRSTEVWSLVLSTLPLGAALGGVVALVGALSTLDPTRPLFVQAGVLAFFCLVWGFLGILLGRVLQQIVSRLSVARVRPLLTLTADLGVRFGLTPREVEAAQAVLDGLTYKDAAAKLSVSPSTVKSHVLSVYQKTGAGNKIELLRMVEAQLGALHQSVDGVPTSLERS